MTTAQIVYMTIGIFCVIVFTLLCMKKSKAEKESQDFEFEEDEEVDIAVIHGKTIEEIDFESKELKQQESLRAERRKGEVDLINKKRERQIKEREIAEIKYKETLQKHIDHFIKSVQLRQEGYPFLDAEDMAFCKYKEEPFSKLQETIKGLFNIELNYYHFATDYECVKNGMKAHVLSLDNKYYIFKILIINETVNFYVKDLKTDCEYVYRYDVDSSSWVARGEGSWSFDCEYKAIIKFSREE